MSIGGEILKLLTSHNIALGSSASEKGEAYQVSACSQENIQYPYSFHLMLMPPLILRGNEIIIIIIFIVVLLFSSSIVWRVLFVLCNAKYVIFLENWNNG